MKRSLLTAISVFSVVLSIACLNDYYSVDKDGELHEANPYEYERTLHKNFYVEGIASRLPEIHEKLEESGSYMDLSDYATNLMRLGKYELSKDILKALYELHPDEYQLAANLGTAYELCGEVDSALKYINRGIELNPESHQGSEWVHVKILEAKKEIEKNKNWLKHNTILGLTEEQESDDDVRSQLWIQLVERFPFTPANDPMMADLLVDLGDCFSSTISVEYGLAYYEVSKFYHGNSSAAIDEKIKHANELIEEYKNAKPNEKSSHGIVERFDPIDYKDIMDEHDQEPEVEIAWDKINLDLDSLLGMIDERPAPVKIVEETIEGPSLGEGRKRVKNPYVKWILLAGGVILVIVLYNWVRKK
ncbi:tetratricopeptide repeat protein [Paracrocinitomix mangrovi]|uniref:tetratricopeptide repeat protein n=1 Tax=Paracrocinitomix mangrovi TaxID=2862509 RepID=UPI001C8EB068|nr:tetratricopeptide repeat protein [Paracrocinitomix mangrovi]UKN01833.1 tetratricopeptide repeat protein [Paracrocinitomix mangrovi]